MPWSLLSWLLCFVLQAGLVGIVFYVLIQLYDFEDDLLNNFDCAKRCNRLVVRDRPLIVDSAAVSAASVRSRGWLGHALHCCRPARRPRSRYSAAGRQWVVNAAL
jgi:Cornichon protein